MKKIEDIIKQELNSHIDATTSLFNLTTQMVSSANLCIDCLSNGGKILLFGNGGSASDAQHIAAELIGRFKLSRKGLPAIALNTDSSVLTSVSNDFGYENVFSRQLEALANKKDVVIAISTSGKSANIIKGLKIASKLGCQSIGFTGKDPSLMGDICNINLNVPSLDTPRIQEMHILVGHIICNIIDQKFKF